MGKLLILYDSVSYLQMKLKIIIICIKDVLGRWNILIFVKGS